MHQSNINQTTVEEKKIRRWNVGVGESIIVPLLKGKCVKDVCSNYRGISLLSIPGKVYAGILFD